MLGEAGRLDDDVPLLFLNEITLQDGSVTHLNRKGLKEEGKV